MPVDQLGSIMSGEQGEAPVVVTADQDVPQLPNVPDFKLAPELLNEVGGTSSRERMPVAANGAAGVSEHELHRIGVWCGFRYCSLCRLA